MALAFVPINQVQDGLNIIFQSSPEVVSCNKIISYFKNTWLTLFPIEMCNHSQTSGPRTSNHLEEYHSKFNREITKSHSNIYAFIMYFKKLESKIATNYTRINMDQTLKKRMKFYVEKDKKILDLTEQRTSETITLEKFIDSMSYLVGSSAKKGHY